GVQVGEVVGAAAGDGDPPRRSLALLAELDGLGSGLIEIEHAHAVSRQGIVRDSDLRGGVVAVAPGPEHPASRSVPRPSLPAQVGVPHELVPVRLPPRLEPSPPGRAPELRKLSYRS